MINMFVRRGDRVIYQDNSVLGKFKRRIGIDDGYLVCNKCKKDFFNLCPSQECYLCWCDDNDVGYY